jgi:hypothetical protein
MVTWQKSLRAAEWVVCGVLVTALASSFFQWPEKRLAPELFAISDLSRFRDRTTLRPHLQHILAEIEDGNMSGAQADKYRADLDNADEVRATNRLTTYGFYENPKTAGYEQNPELWIVVQNKFGQIIRCVVVVPEY